MNGALVLIHGYGVRGGFWDVFAGFAGPGFPVTIAPDLQFQSREGSVRLLADRLLEIHRKHRLPIVLLGHSFGSVLAALAAKELGPRIVTHLVVVAGPYGNTVGRSFSRFQRFLFGLKLLRAGTVRARFYGPDVPESVKEVVRRTHVPEAPAFRAEMHHQKRWFHTGAFGNGLEQRCLTIASEADRMVSVEETSEFSRAIGGELHVFPRGERIGHNDFGVHAPTALKTWRVVEAFLRGTGAGKPDASVLSRG